MPVSVVSAAHAAKGEPSTLHWNVTPGWSDPNVKLGPASELETMLVSGGTAMSSMRKSSTAWPPSRTSHDAISGWRLGASTASRTHSR